MKQAEKKQLINIAEKIINKYIKNIIIKNNITKNVNNIFNKKRKENVISNA